MPQVCASEGLKTRVNSSRVDQILESANGRLAPMRAALRPICWAAAVEAEGLPHPAR